MVAGGLLPLLVIASICDYSTRMTALLLAIATYMILLGVAMGNSPHNHLGEFFDIPWHDYCHLFCTLFLSSFFCTAILRFIRL